MHFVADAGLLRPLASYAPDLAEGDDTWRLRLLLHEFGLTWQAASTAERPRLIEAEPAPVDPRWDAFLAAYAEHLAYHAGVQPPAWVFEPERYLDQFWFPVTADLPALRVEALVHAPAHFEAHGVLLARRELQVV